MCLKDWNFWLTIVTAISAIAAICLSLKQIKVSNKQSLFERRLNIYTITHGLVSLCVENLALIKDNDKDEVLFSNDFIFSFLTNNSFMQEHFEAISNPLKQQHKRDFLAKLEKLKNMAEEVTLIFDGKEATIYSDFIKAYEATLFSMYQYQIVLNKMNEENDESPTEIEKLKVYPLEKKKRAELLISMDNLIKLVNLIVELEVEKKIKKQMSIK